jgi:ABC-type transport system involved in multi-copper enzyme maturation permease subunit
MRYFHGVLGFFFLCLFLIRYLFVCLFVSDKVNDQYIFSDEMYMQYTKNIERIYSIERRGTTVLLYIAGEGLQNLSL